MLLYPSRIDLPSSPLRHLSRPLTTRRPERGTRRRRLPTDRQAPLIPAHLRCGHTYAQLAARFGIAAVYRYTTEAVEALAAVTPDLATAVRTAAHKAFVIPDDTLPPIDRIAADRPYCSGKHKKHGVNVHVLADLFGRLL